MKRFAHIGWAIVLATVCCLGAIEAAERPAILNGVRLASRFGADRVLIRSDYRLDGNVDFRRLKPVPGSASVYRMPSDYRAQFANRNPTNWRTGDKWALYTGAGAPVTVAIEAIVLVLSGGDTDAYVSAIARFENEDTASRVAGLKASEYLAAPSPGLKGVSRQPLIELSRYDGVALQVENLLLARSRALITSEEWEVKLGADEPGPLDRIFLGPQPLRSDIHISRWSPPGQKPLLFVEIVWRSTDNTAVFGANAVIEQGQALSIPDFDPRPGEQMREGSEQADTWDEYEPVFRNAWVIGGRRFVLKFTRYYEGFATELMEMVPGKGLVPTGIFYGDGD